MNQVILVTGASSGVPDDTARQRACDAGAARGLADIALKNLVAYELIDTNPASVARAVLEVVAAPYGRVHVDPSDDGCAMVAAAADRIRADGLRRVAPGNLLRPFSAEFL
ncbi:hypothetical protein [Xanthomonas medicagonis]|uniref:hypothetical protein n=1 Tax=Xanthomonas medicagonis TaxID=3160841 RepID=UPI00351450A1